MILTYDEYKALGGGLDNTAFNIFGYEAEAKIKAETSGRVTEAEAVKRCIARLADILKNADVSEDKTASWSNDGVSESLREVTAEDFEKKVQSIIREYLSDEVDAEGVPLLYLGGVLHD